MGPGNSLLQKRTSPASARSRWLKSSWLWKLLRVTATASANQNENLSCEKLPRRLCAPRPQKNQAFEHSKRQAIIRKATRKPTVREIAEARRAPLPQEIQTWHSGHGDITSSDQT